MAERPGPEERTSLLGDCLVDSDSEFEKRARKIKRRALVASVVMEVVIIGGLVLIPLLSKDECIASYIVTPAPPCHRGTVSEHHDRSSRPPRSKPSPCHPCAPATIPPHLVTHDAAPRTSRNDDGESFIGGTPEGQNVTGALVPDDQRREPNPPEPVERRNPRTIEVSSKVQEGRLVRRVQPLYPSLAITTRREGRVELRAKISTDGRIESLDVIYGDPLLIRSALDAVRQWRYEPTRLNGEPVEVETYITVVYTLAR